MKYVIITQILENYGSHSWNGKGAYPQMWKNKGGCVYMVSDVEIERAATVEFYNSIAQSIESRDDYTIERVIDVKLMSDQQYESSDYATDEQIVNLKYRLGTFFAQQKTKISSYGAEYERIDTWIQEDGKQKSHQTEFLVEGKLLSMDQFNLHISGINYELL